MMMLGAAMTMTSYVDTPAPTAVGLANPASASCVERGGIIAIRDDTGGQVGYCTLPDGRVIEEWALFRAEGPNG